MLLLPDKKITAKKKRERAAQAGQIFLGVLIAGLLGFFIHSNLDFFHHMVDKAADKSIADEAMLELYREHKSAAELLGAPEFVMAADMPELADTSRAVSVSQSTADTLQTVYTPRIVDTLRQISEKYMADTSQTVYIPQPVSASQLAAATAPVTADTALFTPASQPTADTLRTTYTPRVVDTLRQVSEKYMADTSQTVYIPQPVLASQLTAAAIPVTVDTALVTPAPLFGTFLIQNIVCRLADRGDLRINISVELIFDDSNTLRDEVSLKRDVLTVVTLDVVRRHEFGNIAIAPLRADLLRAFNNVLKNGQLNRVNIPDFRVERAVM